MMGSGCVQGLHSFNLAPSAHFHLVRLSQMVENLPGMRETCI